MATARSSNEARLTKRDLVDSIAARTELDQQRVEQVVNCVFDAIAAAIARGEGVEIRGFGSIRTRAHEGYQGRNPRTGIAVDVPPKVRPFFRAGKELRELVNAGRNLTGNDNCNELP